MKIVVVIGTRPEAIKQAPVVWALTRQGAEVVLVSTGQHRQMLDPMLELLELVPQRDLALMQPNQTLPGLTARCIEAFDAVLAEERPDAVLVQGDTTTAFACALASFYRRTPIGHVEAGLRSGSLAEPFPEEANRRLADQLADWLFAPTPGAAEHLSAEGHDRARIHVTGNTVVDALLHIRARVQEQPPALTLDPDILEPSRRRVLITCHRRESFGPGIEGICRALSRLAAAHPETEFVYPVHLNPNVEGPVNRLLGDARNIHLLPPIGYDAFVYLLAGAALVLTDSGGVQEEAPSLGVPVLVMRNRTERPEGIAAGCAVLVGTQESRIFEEGDRLLSDESARGAMAHVANPYGDGQAGERIASILTGGAA